MRRTHPTRDPWQQCPNCAGGGFIYSANEPCMRCAGTGWALRPDWRVYRPRRTR